MARTGKGRPRSISTVAKEAAPLKKRSSPDVNLEPLENISPVEYNPLVPTVSAPDLLLSADLSPPPVIDIANNEGLIKSNAYSAKRIRDLTDQEIQVKTLQIKQIARRKGYKLDTLVHTPDLLQTALDDYDLTCLSLGLYPFQSLLSVWLNTTKAQLVALTSAANVSEAGYMLAMHTDYCVSVVEECAIKSEKPPLFAIYYLKTEHKMYDTENNGQNVPNLSVISGNVTNINVSAADISKNSQIFTAIDSGKGSDGVN